MNFFAKFMPLFVGYTYRHNCYVCKKGLTKFKKGVAVEEKIVFVIIYSQRERHFFEIMNIVNQQKIVNVLIFANRRFSGLEN